VIDVASDNFHPTDVHVGTIQHDRGRRLEEGYIQDVLRGCNSPRSLLIDCSEMGLSHRAMATTFFVVVHQEEKPAVPMKILHIPVDQCFPHTPSSFPTQ
jgi:hypothetical protein